jgi:hypothetical protein
MDYREFIGKEVLIETVNTPIGYTKISGELKDVVEISGKDMLCLEGWFISTDWIVKIKVKE